MNNQEKMPYIKKPILTNNELMFYQEFKRIAIKYGYIILTKIRMADLLEIRKDIKQKAEWYTYFAKIKSKHVDFALAEINNLNPLILIEVDDGSHQRADRIERDKFIDKAYTDAGYYVLHAKNLNGLEDIICQILKIYKKPWTSFW